MRLFSGIGNKQGSKKTIFLTLPIFVLMSVHPTPALAFALPFTTVDSQQLWDNTTSIATTDPELLKSMTTVPMTPLNTADANAWAPTANSPITTPGNWPEKKTVAWQPVNATFATTDTTQMPIDPGSPAIAILQGMASYYSRAGCLGCDARFIMANGQALDDNKLTMAIGADMKHLVGHMARVTNLATGKSVTVPITDTGGFHQAKYGFRVADLSVATKNAIGMKGGLGQVKVEVL